MQVDLFFYREPEEAKEEEEELAVADYNNYGGGAIDDQWSAQISEGQWAAEVQPPIVGAPVAAGGWSEAEGNKVETVILC